MNWLSFIADAATIVTALVAAVAYGTYRWAIYQRVVAVERLLASKDKANDDSLTVQQIAAALKLTNGQVIEAASRNKKIEPFPGSSGNDYRLRLAKSSS